jgi:hypothetical protein
MALMSRQLAPMLMEPTASLLMDFQQDGREVGLDFCRKSCRENSYEFQSKTTCKVLRTEGGGGHILRALHQVDTHSSVDEPGKLSAGSHNCGFSLFITVACVELLECRYFFILY